VYGRAVDARTFAGLTDTPSVYEDQGGRLVAVKETETGLEFIVAPITGVTVKEIDGTPNVSGVTTIQVANGTLTDDGGGQVTLQTGGGGGGGMVSTETLRVSKLLYDETLSVAGSFSFDSIPQDYDDLEIILYLRQEGTGTTSPVRLTFNNDTNDANYSNGWFRDDTAGHSWSAARLISLGLTRALRIPGASSSYPRCSGRR
jgi:hypothetical protein